MRSTSQTIRHHFIIPFTLTSYRTSHSFHFRQVVPSTEQTFYKHRALEHSAEGVKIGHLKQSKLPKRDSKYYFFIMCIIYAVAG